MVIYSKMGKTTKVIQIANEALTLNKGLENADFEVEIMDHLAKASIQKG